MPFPYEEFDLSGVRTYPLSSRHSKARAEDFARPVQRGASFAAWFDSLPAILGAADLRRVVRAIVEARQRNAGVMWGIGAHVIKTGVSPVLIDLMERGYVSALAMNGAGVIHDFEIALSGATSEDVDEALGPGRFGMAEETGRLLNEIVGSASARGLGFGQAVAAYLAEVKPAHAGRSLLVAAHRHRCAGLRARCARHRHRPHAPGCIGRRDRRRQSPRLPLLHIVSRPLDWRRVLELRLGGRAA